MSNSFRNPGLTYQKFLYGRPSGYPNMSICLSVSQGEGSVEYTVFPNFIWLLSPFSVNHRVKLVLHGTHFGKCLSSCVLPNTACPWRLPQGFFPLALHKHVQTSAYEFPGPAAQLLPKSVIWRTVLIIRLFLHLSNWNPLPEISIFGFYENPIDTGQNEVPCCSTWQAFNYLNHVDDSAWFGALAWESGFLGSNPCFSLTDCVPLGKSLRLRLPQFPHLWNEDYNRSLQHRVVVRV